MPTGQPNPQRRPSSVRETQRALREMRRAEKLAESGQVAEAIERLHEAVRFGADRYTCFLRIARLHQSRQQWREAVSAAEQAIAEQPAKLTAREAVITFYLESRDYPRAIDASKALLKLSPRHVPARDALGAAYMGLGDLNAAIRVANDLIRLDPSNPSHRFTKAHLSQHCGEIGTAVEEFERVTRIAPDSELAVTAREQLEMLDTMQLDQIMTLACEDTIFRAKLIRDSDSAMFERGFRLSESGREVLHEMATEGLAEMESPCRPNLYH
jgi:tetratricopeptide (TPR) repeat protein